MQFVSPFARTSHQTIFKFLLWGSFTLAKTSINQNEFSLSSKDIWYKSFSHPKLLCSAN